MAYKINKAQCIGCHTCMGVCPMGAISVDGDGKCVINPSMCVSCGACAGTCPVSAIAPDVQ